MKYKVSFLNSTNKRKDQFAGVKIKIDTKTLPKKWEMTKFVFIINALLGYRMNHKYVGNLTNGKGYISEYYYGYRGGGSFIDYIMRYIKETFDDIYMSIRKL